MTQNVSTAIQNNFIAGLKTEFTGLNFPENACTATQNCVFSLIGDVSRRLGFDYETNFALQTINRAGFAISSFKWDNVGGDGLTQIYVLQVGATLYFFQASNATVPSPLSTTLLGSTVNINNFLVDTPSNPFQTECTYAYGNGYLFVYHPNCDPFYCTFSSGVVTATVIPLQIRDFNGIPEAGISASFRPTTLTSEHSYNLANQGWGSSWIAFSTTTVTLVLTGSYTFIVNSTSLAITPGQTVTVTAKNFPVSPVPSATGTVTSYNGNVLIINITTLNVPDGNPYSNWSIGPGTALTNLLQVWYNAAQSSYNIGNNYPSNADVWWTYRSTNINSNNPSGKFDPAAMAQFTVQSNVQAPQGSFVLNAFNQDRSTASGIAGITSITTSTRPTNGCWFQGRVWYTGVSANFQPQGDMPYYTWTENIYFSQIITQPAQFGWCYQQNDPTNDKLFDILPDDGGVITISGAGTIYKLFPIQNGLIVGASNGIWFITGSQGIGFSATDYTITKISSVKVISNTSWIDVQGFPMFWNIEGIYAISPAQQGGGLRVEPLTVGTILSYYNAIPLSSKKYARGDYDPIDYVVQWAYKSTPETGVTDRYQFDTILNFNVANKAFYPYVFPTGTNPYIHDIKYIQNPSGSITVEQPVFKYLTSIGTYNPNTNITSYNFTFAEEQDGTTYFDWFSSNNVGINFTSTFTTGYMLPSEAQRLWQPMYLYLYSENIQSASYVAQGIWDFATSGNSGKYSTRLVVNNNIPNFNRLYRRHRLRGHGVVFQLNISSVSGQPFNFMGWSLWNIQNASV